MGSRLIDVQIICTHCGLEGVAKARTGISGHKLPYGWEERLVSDPIRGTELVRQWEATLCQECAAKEYGTDAGPEEGSA